jgi:signal transduction histidine kinase
MRAVRSQQALQRGIDGLPASAVVLDANGTIVAVNQAWLRFGAENGLRPGAAGVGTSYLDVCDAHGARATEGPIVAAAIRRVLGGSDVPMRRGYSCHGPGAARWFQVEVASLRHRGWPGVLVTHVQVDEAFIRREIADLERRRIARELHDTTAQNLASAVLDLERVARSQRQALGSVSSELDEAIALCRRSVEEVRSLAYEIGPPGLEPTRLVDSLKQLATTFARRTGFAVMLSCSPVAADDLTLEAAEAIYRTAEESLHNARRHSGGQAVVLRIRRGEADLRLEVSDDGRGIPADAVPGKGLTDVRERLESCGGRLEVPAAPGGPVLVARVPAEGKRDADDSDRR